MESNKLIKTVKETLNLGPVELFGLGHEHRVHATIEHFSFALKIFKFSNSVDLGMLGMLSWIPIYGSYMSGMSGVVSTTGHTERSKSQ